MAKKKENLSPEELLEQALVPEQEWPYRVPENWVWVRFGSLVEIIGGGTPSKSNSDYWGGDIPWASVKDIKGDYLSETVDRISELGLANSSANLADINDLILVTRIEPGKTIIPQIRVAVNQDLKVVKSKLPIEFLHYYFKNFRNDFVEQSSGSTVLGITLDKVQSTVFPLPPLAEQQRIVNRIESLFEKLDQAKGLIQDALDSFENRKAAILHKAFSGELTKKWREENGVGMDSWEEKTFDECTVKITDGFHNSPKPVDSGYPYIMAGHVKPFNINFQNGMFMDEKNHRELFKKANPQKGDVLLVNIGAGTGTPSVIEVDFEFSFKNCAILKLRILINSYFIFYYLLYIQKKVLAEITRGGAQPFLSLKLIKEMTIILPSKSEQDEIVTLLSDLLSKENDAQELLDRIENIDLMKKAILALAFRGELGTNDPSEESAQCLLREVLSTK